MSKFECEVRAFIEGKRELFGADAKVWSKGERAEAPDAPFVVTFEGPLYEIYNDGYCEGMRFTEGDELRAIAKRHGFFFESYYAWMIVPCQ